MLMADIREGQHMYAALDFVEIGIPWRPRVTPQGSAAHYPTSRDSTRFYHRGGGGAGSQKKRRQEGEREGGERYLSERLAETVPVIIALSLFYYEGGGPPKISFSSRKDYIQEGEARRVASRRIEERQYPIRGRGARLRAYEIIGRRKTGPYLLS